MKNLFRASPRTVAALSLGILLALWIGWKCIAPTSAEVQSPPPPAPRTIADPRIVSLSPAITETVYLLGLGGHLAGRTFQCDFPDDVTNVPIALVSTEQKPAELAEAIAALRPAYVLMPDSMVDSPLHNELAARKISHLGIKAGTPTDLYQSVFELAERFDETDRATAWCAQIDVLSSALRERIETDCTRVGRTPAVLLVVGRMKDGLAVAGSQSFHQGLFDALGIRNACLDPAPWKILTDREVAALRPDIILEARPGASDEDIVRAATDWTKAPESPAVRTGDVHILTEPWILRSGPRIDDFLRTVALHVHTWSSRSTPAPAQP